MWKSPYAYLFFLGFVVHVIAAFYSEGFHHPDEHFQILEFSNYKLGDSPASELSWEFEAQERPTLQPTIGFLVIKLIKYTGIDNPFFHALFLRLITGLLAWYMISKISLLLLNNFSTERGKSFFILIGQVLWFVPYVNVRFSSENLAGLTFLIAIYLILLGIERKSPTQPMLTVGAGFLLGLSFFFRFQIAFSIIGLIIWLLVINRYPTRQLLTLIGAGTLGGIVCILIDAWFYGETVLTPYIYFHIQIVEDLVSTAGVSPWWSYIALFIVRAIPPLGVPLLIGLAIGIYKKPTSIFVFVLIPFVIGHMMVGHKEMRFMFPMLFSFIYLVSVGFDHLMVRYSQPGRSIQYLYSGFYGINLVLLTLAIFLPAQEAICYYRHLYHPLSQDQTLVAIGDSPYKLVGAEANFYKPPNADVRVFADYEEINGFLKGSRIQSLLILSREPVLDHDFEDFKKERVYTLFPDWLLEIKVNNWQERSRVWSIYRVYRE